MSNEIAEKQVSTKVVRDLKSGQKIEVEIPMPYYSKREKTFFKVTGKEAWDCNEVTSAGEFQLLYSLLLATGISLNGNDSNNELLMGADAVLIRRKAKDNPFDI